MRGNRDDNSVRIAVRAVCAPQANDGKPTAQAPTGLHSSALLGRGEARVCDLEFRRRESPQLSLLSAPGIYDGRARGSTGRILGPALVPVRIESMWRLEGKRGRKLSLTLSLCPRGILGDVVPPSGNEWSYQDAIVCQDSTGTNYRFRCYLGTDAPPDVWSVGLFDRFRGVSPPAWADWVADSAAVDAVQWSEVT